MYNFDLLTLILRVTIALCNFKLLNGENNKVIKNFIIFVILCLLVFTSFQLLQIDDNPVVSTTKHVNEHIIV